MADTLYKKTAAGRGAIKDRHSSAMTGRQRSLLILMDGQKTVAALLASTAPTLGVTMDDVTALIAAGFIAPADSVPDFGESSIIAGGDPEPPVTQPTSSPADAPKAAAAPTRSAARPSDEAERKRRYAVAYPIATAATAKLGLRGFRLNLAVEAAQGYDGLLELLPKIEAATSRERTQPLRDALDGRL